MMPAPYDPKLAIARLQTDSTDALRARYPHLNWVWDQLDDLRDTMDGIQFRLDDLREGVEGAVEEYESEQSIDDLITSLKELTDDA